MPHALNGAIDMHIHGSPSVAVRRETPVMMRDMGALGYRAFVLKDHYYPSAGVCSMLNRWLGEETGVTACGSIILNNAVGGLNLYAVDTAVNMGARVVSFPTLSARCHLDAMAAITFAGSGKGMSTSESDNAMTVLGDDGELKKEAVALIEYMAAHPDICLWTGHLSTAEVDKVAACAFEKGVKKLYANHPYWMIDASLDHIRAWAKTGMYLELNMAVMEPWSDGTLPADPKDVLELINTVPNEQLILCTDFGQAGNPSPTDGMLSYHEFLLKNGVSQRQFDIMAKEVPAKLLGLD